MKGEGHRPLTVRSVDSSASATKLFMAGPLSSGPRDLGIESMPGHGGRLLLKDDRKAPVKPGEIGERPHFSRL